MQPSEGVLIVDKPSGPTSHDVVKQARQVYRTKAVGHAGTLDPLASGVLVLLFGEATKLSSYLTLADKAYTCRVHFGTGTDTLDRQGTVVSEVELGSAWLDEERLRAALAAERARTAQEPPAYSALKIQGVAAHRLSRQGAQLELPTRPVIVKSLQLDSFTQASADITLTVSKGYYVRSFARDLGGHLGVPAHVSELRRLASGNFTLNEAAAWPPAEPPSLMPLEVAARRALPSSVLSEQGVRRARFGQRLTRQDFLGEPAVETEPGQASAWFDPSGTLVALGTAHEAEFAVLRGFAERNHADAPI